MQYLSLKSAKKILETIAAKEGLLTWYNIVKFVDGLDVEGVPPVYIVFQELNKQGYIYSDLGVKNNNSKYSLTELGREFLSQSS